MEELSIKKNVSINREYDFIFSLGNACMCAGFMRKNSLQNRSYPLDWIYGSDFNHRIEFLLNNFKHFIDKKDLVKIGSREYPEPCDIYKNERNGLIFNHDFKINVPINKSYLGVINKYTRRILRLYKNIICSKDVLVIFMENPLTPEVGEDLLGAQLALSKKFRTTNINILFFKHDENMPSGEFKIEEISDSITKVTLFNMDYEKGEGMTLGNEKNCDMVLSGIKLKNKLKIGYYKRFLGFVRNHLNKK